MKLLHDLSVWRRGGRGSDLNNEMRFIGLTRFGEMHLVPCPRRVFLPAVARFDMRPGEVMSRAEGGSSWSVRKARPLLTCMIVLDPDAPQRF